MTTPALGDAVSRLRALLGERVVSGDDISNSFFTDEEVFGLLNMANQNLNLAAMYGWSIKAAEFARLIDYDESGSNRKLSQRYRQAQSQLTFFQQQVTADSAAVASMDAVGPKVLNLRDDFRGPHLALHHGNIVWVAGD